jgi:hypothetical protein
MSDLGFVGRSSGKVGTRATARPNELSMSPGFVAPKVDAGEGGFGQRGGRGGFGQRGGRGGRGGGAGEQSQRGGRGGSRGGLARGGAGGPEEYETLDYAQPGQRGGYSQQQPGGYDADYNGGQQFQRGYPQQQQQQQRGVGGYPQQQPQRGYPQQQIQPPQLEVQWPEARSAEPTSDRFHIPKTPSASQFKDVARSQLENAQVFAPKSVADSQPKDAAVRDAVFGLVDGGDSGVIKLHKSYPTADAPNVGEPTAQAKKGRWLKILLPKQSYTRINDSGVPTVENWLCVQVINGKTAEVQSMWVCETVNDVPSFQRFDLYPRDI